MIFSIKISPFWLLGVLTLSPLIARADNENLALGNPSHALTPATLPITDLEALAPGFDCDNVLLDKAAYALSYNRTKGGPNWVSWHLEQSDRGRSGRANDFRPDQTLPAPWWIRPSDYRASGYDRGHQCPSADRTSDEQANSATFLMSNMLPQVPDLNRQLWRKFEEYCRDQLKDGAREEYIFCGGSGTKGTIAKGKVNVPASCWKIVVILPTGDDDLARIDAATRVIAINVPNEDGPQIASGSWRSFLVSVDSLEQLTGYDFLSNVPEDVQEVLKAKVDSGRAPNSTADDTPD